MTFQAAACLHRRGARRAVREPGVRPNRRADVPIPCRVEGSDRVRVRRRHLARAEKGGRGRPPDLVARRGVLPAVFPGRDEDRLQRVVRRQRGRLRRQQRRRRAGAADASSDGRSRRSAGRPTAGACCSPRAARAAASATTSSSPSAWPAACRKNCPCRTASSARTRPTARSSSTCRCRRTSATGSAIAAAGRRTCGCSI